MNLIKEARRSGQDKSLRMKLKSVSKANQGSAGRQEMRDEAKHEEEAEVMMGA